MTLALPALAPLALAGPPLVCHPFDIGSAKSLPWGGGTSFGDWNKTWSDYDTKQLTEDTLALLADSTPVIVRMETIRRAALYGAKDRQAGKELLIRLGARADEGKAGKANPLFVFDYGYLIETMKQASLTREADKGPSPTGLLDGYAYIQRALAMRGNDPEMEFAAAIVSAWPKREQHRQHFRKAVAGAAGDSILIQNLVSHFSDQGSNLAELRAKAALADHK